MYQEFPKWLYSVDHGSVVVDTAEDAALLPDVNWYSAPTLDGEPYVRSSQPAPSPVDNLHTAEGAQAAINAALAKIDAPETVRVDRRSKEWRDRQVPK